MKKQYQIQQPVVCPASDFHKLRFRLSLPGCEVVQGHLHSAIAAFTSGCYNYRFCKLFSAVNNTMSDCSDFVKALNNTCICICQRVNYELDCFCMCRHSLFRYILLSTCRLIGKSSRQYRFFRKDLLREPPPILS